jgi:hypothetical protein
MRFGSLNIQSLYRAGSLVTVSKELSKYKLDLVAVQGVRWEVRIQIFLWKRGNENHELGAYSNFSIQRSKLMEP